MGSGASKAIDENDDPAIGSGVTLSPELEADIIRDFQSKVLQEEWNKFGTSILVHRNERIQQLQQYTQRYQQQRQMNSIHYQQRMASLDNAIDSMQAKITDQLVENEYDVQKLLKQYSHWLPPSPPSDTTTTTTAAVVEESKDGSNSKPLPCLGERAHWMDCQTKYSTDSRPCNFYVQALEQCVHRTMFGGSSSSSTDTNPATD